MVGERIVFYMDEHVPLAVTQGLRRRGVDVLTAEDVGMVQIPDEQHLAFATNAGRVRVTQDKDFLRLHSAAYPHTGIVYAPQGASIGSLVRGLMLIHDVMPPEDMVGKLEYV